MPVPVELVAHISNSKIIGIQGQSRLQSETLFWEDGRKGGRKGKREERASPGREKGRTKKQLLSFVELSVRKCGGWGGIKEMEIKAVKIFEMLLNSLPIGRLPSTSRNYLLPLPSYQYHMLI